MLKLRLANIVIKDDVMSQTDMYQRTKEFHTKFDNRIPIIPAPLPTTETIFRASFVLEELVEYVATTCQDEAQFNNAMDQMQVSFKKAVEKMQKRRGKISQHLLSKWMPLVILYI